MSTPIASLEGDRRSLAVWPGQMVLVTGPVGAGKTRLLRALAGLETMPDGIHGQTVEHARMLGDFMPPLWLAPTLGEELAFGLHATEDERMRVLAAWRLADVPAETAVEALNRLQGLRLALATMELAEARLALLDNPTAALPPEDATLLRTDIAAWIQRSGTAVVIACNHWQDWRPWVQQTWWLHADTTMPEPQTDD